MLVSLTALMVTSSILRWILQAFSNSFSHCCVYTSNLQVRQHGWFIIKKRGHAVLATFLPCINLRWKVAAISSIHNKCPYNFAHLQGQDFLFDQEVRIAFGQAVVWCFLSLS